jgi:RNA polymerase sigma-70 factor (ECF subfamily)
MDQDREKLAEGLRRSDPSIFDALLEQYQHRLFRYLLSITGNRAVSEDLFQETWLRVLERGYQFRPKWKFEVWLFSIARHLAIDLARRKKSDSLDQLMDPEAGIGFEPTGSDPTPLEHLMSGERSERMSNFLGNIPAVYREVLTLRFHEDLALEEMAELIQVPLSTVKSRLYRGLESLKKQIEVGNA